MARGPDDPQAPPFPMEPAARRRALLTVGFTLFLDLTAFGIILPVLPYYAEARGGSPGVVALLATAFSLAQFVMSPVLGRWSDRAGRRPVMLISVAGSAASSLVLGFADALWLVFAARLLSGVSKANVSTAHAYVADLVPASQRARVMGMMGAALSAGFVFGPALGGLLSTEELPTLPFFAAAALSAVNWLMAWFWLPETRVGARADAPAVGRIRRLRLQGAFGTLVAITFVYFAAFAAMESVFALFSEHTLGWQARETGIFLTFLGVLMALVQGWLVGRAVDGVGEAWTLTLGIVGLGLGLGWLAGIPYAPEWLGIALHEADGSMSGACVGLVAVGAAAIALGNGLVMAPTSALVARTSRTEEVGLNMGLKESAGALARITGPVLAGVLFEVYHPSTPLFVGALLCAANLLLAARLRRGLRREAAAGALSP